MIRNGNDALASDENATSKQEGRARSRLARGTAEQGSAGSRSSVTSSQVTALPDAVIVVSATGEIVETNTLAETLLGYAQHELRGMMANEILHCPSLEGDERDYTRQIHVELVTASEGACVVHRSDRSIPVDVMLSPDLANATIIAVIRENTTDDRQHLRDEDVASIGHDLRSPLSVISLEVAMLDHKIITPTSDTAAALRRIGRNIDHLDHLVSDLLDLSAIDTARFQIERSPVELGELVLGVVDRAVATPHRPRVSVLISHTATVIGDERRIERVLTNFIQNAIRYTPHDSPIIVELRIDDGYAHVGVEDHGPGLPPDEARCAFEKFRRGSNARGRTGFGLGLFVSRKIIDAHGGRIGVESTFGKGSCFYFELPLAHDSTSST
jgi:PAS domain S-box-containing protein